MHPSAAPSAAEYHRFRSRSVRIGGATLTLAVKPGLIGQGRDEAAELLAAEMVVPRAGTVVSFQSGSGLIGAVAALSGAATVHLTDRSQVAALAGAATIEANALAGATVALGQGAAPLPGDLVADLVTIRIPTEKPAVVQLLADAFRILRVGGRCCIAGATNEGIKSAVTLLEAMFGNTTVLATRGGCRAVMAVKRGDTPADGSVLSVPPAAFHAIDVVLRGQATRLFSRPGVFSWEHLDEATALLVEEMQVRPGDSVLDLGCGSGPLGITAARLCGSGSVCMLDVDSEAVNCAARAVDLAGLPHCEVLPSDVAAAVLDRRFDVVVTNPPFHVGKGTDLDVPMQFIADAHTVLKPGGSLQLVANRTLPYERMVQERFGAVTTLHDGARFKILGARR